MLLEVAKTINRLRKGAKKAEDDKYNHGARYADGGGYCRALRD